MKSLFEVLISYPPLNVREPRVHTIDPETGIWPVVEWQSECGRGIVPKQMGVTTAGGHEVRKISTGRKKINGKLWVPERKGAA